MAITTGSRVEISLRMIQSNQRIFNVYQYQVAELGVVLDAKQQAEAWWNHVKSTYRALAQSGAGRSFDSVIIRELNNPTGDLAEYSISSAEGVGTRAAGSLGPYLPTFSACGVRLTVASRATRPGQKRVPFMTEGDVAGDPIDSGFITLVNNLMNVLTVPLVLGAPAIGTVLNPIVCRKDATGYVTASQAVTGYVVNPYATSQISRKFGRGM